MFAAFRKRWFPTEAERFEKGAQWARDYLATAQNATEREHVEDTILDLTRSGFNYRNDAFDSGARSVIRVCLAPKPAASVDVKDPICRQCASGEPGIPETCTCERAVTAGVSSPRAEFDLDALSEESWWVKELAGLWGSADYKVTHDTRRAAKVALNLIAFERDTMRSRQWRSMDDAPKDGTTINVAARYVGATAGFPMYAGWRADLPTGEGWYVHSNNAPVKVLAWAWRPRDDWPSEPKNNTSPIIVKAE